MGRRATETTPVHRNDAEPDAATGRERRASARPILGGGTPWTSFGQSRQGIGLRLLTRVLLFSSAVTLILTLFQLYLDYHRDVGEIEIRLDEIEHSYAASLGESLWTLDRNQLEIQLNGILRLPAIRAVEIRETTGNRKPLTVSVGRRGSHSAVAREIPLVHAFQGEVQPIGTLYLEATLSGVYQTLENRALIILLSQSAKTFVVSFFILYIFYRLVTRHLASIATFVGGYDLRRPSPDLGLRRDPPREPDELDKVVTAFNRLCVNLRRAYDSLQSTNAKLEWDIAARRQTERALRESEERFRDYAEIASDWFWESDDQNRFTHFGERRQVVMGETADRLIGRTPWTSSVSGDAVAASTVQSFMEQRKPFRDFEFKRTDAKGRIHYINVNGRPIFNAAGRFLGYRGTATDLTERRETEERLRQSQKMEAVGQLTGGVAHDFNNLLTVIIGNADILAETPELSEPHRRLAETIRATGERGAALTNRLLAFSRRQTLQPRTVDVNVLLSGMEGLLRRTLGEAIEVEWVRGAGVWHTFIDPGQLENALLNLAINARDAMPAGGRLTIETGNAFLDQAYADTEPDVRPGQYVMVAVADSGQGMTAEVAARAFEPFFTTKEAGKGTGLGLSMVYGFVKQSGGHVKIYSEIGQGTIIRLYLPRAAGVGLPAEAAEALADAPTGTETILAVEDEAAVREYVETQLTRLGYTVIAVANGPAALAALARDTSIALLFTDIVMPGGMNGRQLAEAATRLRPGLKVLYTSGYTENAVVHHGRLDPGVDLLNKPYRAMDLARKIRIVLERA